MTSTFRLALAVLLIGITAGDVFAQMSMPEARAFFVNRTRVSFSSGHGTQVSYMAPNGAVYLWYPGNRVVLPGSWSLEPRAMPGYPPRAYAILCFQYGPNTYNPVTGRGGGGPECGPADRWARYAVDQAPGDVFGLARRQSPPFILTPERTTIAELRRRMSR